MTIAIDLLFLVQIFGLLQTTVKCSNTTTFHAPHMPICNWKSFDNAPEIYYVNLDRSIHRKVVMDSHLSSVHLNHTRVRGLTPKEIFIPPDVEKNWLTRHCSTQTVWKGEAGTGYNNEKFAMAAMCGRKKNTPKEIGCSVSHLYAMRQAIYSTTATSRYALIVEDDVFFPFNVDFNAMAQSAPADFGILQLFNSNQPSMKNIWKKYLKNHNTLWLNRNAASFEFWSTCGYLIDRVVMKPIIDAMVIVDRIPGAHKYILNWVVTLNNMFYYKLFVGVTEFKLVAGVTNPCTPKECCSSNATHIFNGPPPCVYAPRGFQADSFLYAMTRTYMLSFPIITNGLGEYQTF